MRLLLTAPLPPAWLLMCKLCATALLSVLQALAFVAVALALGTDIPVCSWAGVHVLGTLICGALMLGALGLLLLVHIKQLENFAGTMNFVIFPMYFISSALYPLWKLQESGAEWVYQLARGNPFTYAVEWLRFSLYSKVFVQVNNLLDRRYASASQPGSNGFRDNGSFQARPFLPRKWPIPAAAFDLPCARRSERRLDATHRQAQLRGVAGQELHQPASVGRVGRLNDHCGVVTRPLLQLSRYRRGEQQARRPKNTVDGMQTQFGIAESNSRDGIRSTAQLRFRSQLGCQAEAVDDGPGAQAFRTILRIGIDQ
ncbi:hypothetical protein J2W39_006135 [Variovorax paradoxus]|uniref:ABC-2 type transporter transmembrane domain-containing protein n=1 Tax=Variovorax paradoxus TaxID=34073 RepID=A0AAW8ENY6_VARPD|nr:hypothetical protein [Variovorax paradoxus]